MHANLWTENLKGRQAFGGQFCGGRIISKWTLYNCDLMV
jgi:hypothetical protein